MAIELIPNTPDRFSQVGRGISAHDASKAIDRLRAAAGISARPAYAGPAPGERAGKPGAIAVLQPGRKITAGAGRGGDETPAQRAPLNLVELALSKIARDEFGDGTAANPGAHATRASLQQMLHDGRDASGKGLGAGQRRFMEARLNQLTDSIQQMQHRKAELQGMAVPPQEVASTLDDGEEAFSPKGEAWVKRDGILYRSE